MSAGYAIIVFAHHGLGDLLMAIPLLRSCDAALRIDDQLVVVVKTRAEAAVLDLIPWRARMEVRTLDRGPLRLARAAVSLRRSRPALLLAPHATDGAGMALMSRLIGARCSVGPTGRWSRLGFSRSVTARPGVHKVRYYLRFAEEAGLPLVSEPDVRIPVDGLTRARAELRLPRRSTDERWIAVAPGSGSVEAHKRWPVTRYQELMARLLKHSASFRIGVFGNAAEAPLLWSLVEGCTGLDGRCEIFAENDVGRALALLGQFDCVVAGCAGAGHMAAAVGVPIVGLFGPTNPGFTAPFTQKLRVLRAGLPCSPCYRKGFISGCGKPVCMSAITAEQVLSALLRCLEGAFTPEPRWYATTNVSAPPSTATMLSA